MTAINLFVASRCGDDAGHNHRHHGAFRVRPLNPNA
jgi:hypothetical protein